MPIGFWFWLIWVICAFWGGYFIYWPLGRWHLGAWFWLMLMIAMLGWHDFGAPWSALVH